jgi:hypothetical protein
MVTDTTTHTYTHTHTHMHTHAHAHAQLHVVQQHLHPKNKAYNSPSVHSVAFYILTGTDSETVLLPVAKSMVWDLDLPMGEVRLGFDS